MYRTIRSLCSFNLSWENHDAMVFLRYKRNLRQDASRKKTLLHKRAEADFPPGTLTDQPRPSFDHFADVSACSSPNLRSIAVRTRLTMDGTLTNQSRPRLRRPLRRRVSLFVAQIHGQVHTKLTVGGGSRRACNSIMRPSTLTPKPRTYGSSLYALLRTICCTDGRIAYEPRYPKSASLVSASSSWCLKGESTYGL